MTCFAEVVSLLGAMFPSSATAAYKSLLENTITARPLLCKEHKVHTFSDRWFRLCSIRKKAVRDATGVGITV